jgi:hypothetical protein
VTKPTLHPWLGTPEAVQAARRAVRVPEYKMPGAARALGPDELLSEAFTILTECALPPRERGNVVCAECGGTLENVRAGAKYCGATCRNKAGVRRFRDDAKPAPPPAQPKGHIGSMWTWPEDERMSYAAREVGLRLCHYLVTRSGRSETPGSPWLENTDLAQGASDPTARDVIEDFLVARGIDFDGTETLDELAEAATRLQGGGIPCAIAA